MSTDNFGALGADFFIKTYDKGSSMSQADLDALVQYVQLTSTIMAIGEFTPDVQQSVWMILERVDVPSATGYTVTNNTEVTMTSGGLVTIDSMPWTKITGKPAFFSGSYADLTGKPTIPTSFSSLVNSENTFSLNGDGLLTFPNGTTSEGNSITIPVDESLTVNLSTGQPLELNSTFKINPESIKLPTANGVICSGEETAASSWALDSGNKTFYFPDAGDGVSPQIRYSTPGNDGMQLFTAAKPIKITTASNTNWTFGTTGTLTLPASGNVVDSTGVSQLANRVEGTVPLELGSNTISINLQVNATYTMWLRAVVDNGVIAYNATVTITNVNLPVLGQQQAYAYSGAGTVLDFTSLPTQIVGTAGNVTRSPTLLGTPANQFTFVIQNDSGEEVDLHYGWTKI